MAESETDPKKFLSGNFETLQAASIFAVSTSKSGKSFTSSRWFRRQEIFYNESQNGNTPRPNSLPEIIKNSSANTVIEVGGGSGWIWNLIGRERKSNLKYYNLELAETCNYFKNLVQIDSSIRFISTIKNLELNPNDQVILYANSTLQYLDNAGLEEIFRTINLCTEALFDELIFTDFASYWTLQEYYGSKIPYFVRNKSDFLEFMEIFGFKFEKQVDTDFGNSDGDEATRTYFTESLHFLKVTG